MSMIINKGGGASIGNPTSFTPASQGLGTLANLECSYIELSSGLLLLNVRLDIGTTTVDEAQIGLPGSYVVNSTACPSATVLGTLYGHFGASYSPLIILGTGGDAFLNISDGRDAGLNRLLPRAGNSGIFTNGDTISFSVMVPVS